MTIFNARAATMHGAGMGSLGLMSKVCAVFHSKALILTNPTYCGKKGENAFL